MILPTAKPVCIESPFRGDLKLNLQYADACMLDSLRRGEAPFLGHLLYPRVLDDTRDADRTHGIASHCAWLLLAETVIVCTDLGVSDGMLIAVQLAGDHDIPVQYRTLGRDWTEQDPRIGSTPGFHAGWNNGKVAGL